MYMCESSTDAERILIGELNTNAKYILPDELNIEVALCVYNGGLTWNKWNCAGNMCLRRGNLNMCEVQILKSQRYNLVPVYIRGV